MGSGDVPNYYELLGLSRSATKAEVRAAFRRLSKTAHPDAGGNDGLFRLLKIAHDTLIDDEARAAYDRYESGGPPRGHRPAGGGQPCPNLLGQDVRFAEAALESAGIPCGLVPMALSIGVDFQVCGQWPAPGSPLADGETVILGFGITPSLGQLLAPFARAVGSAAARVIGDAASSSAKATAKALGRASDAYDEALRRRNLQRAEAKRQHQRAVADAHRELAGWRPKREAFIQAQRDRGTWIVVRNWIAAALLLIGLVPLLGVNSVRLSRVVVDEALPALDCSTPPCALIFGINDAERPISHGTVTQLGQVEDTPFPQYPPLIGRTVLVVYLLFAVPLLLAIAGMPVFGRLIRVISGLGGVAVAAAAAAWPSLAQLLLIEAPVLSIHAYALWPVVASGIAMALSAVVGRPRRGLPRTMRSPPKRLRQLTRVGA